MGVLEAPSSTPLNDQIRIEPNILCSHSQALFDSRSHRPLTKTALGLAGLLKRPGKVAVSPKAMDQAVPDAAAALHSKAIAKGRSNT